MTKRYVVHNLRCAGCAARIEDAIAGLPGVKSAAINLDSARLRVEGEQIKLTMIKRPHEQPLIRPFCYILENLIFRRKKP